MSDSEVIRLLVSGDDGQILLFFGVCFQCNAIERRKQTVFCTAIEKDREDILKAARQERITIQEIVRTEDGKEEYIMLVQGDHPGWKIKKGKNKK